jgi:chromosome segregation ATPase
MAEGRTLDQTAVGMALERRMEEMRAAYERELGSLKRELDEARRQTTQNQQRIEEINEDRLRLEERLDEEKAYRRQLRKNLKQLQRERSEERRKERKNREQGARKHSHKQKECMIM